MSDGRRHAVAADTVFDGATVHRDCAVIIEGSDIVALLPRHELPDSIPVQDLLDGAWHALRAQGGS